MKQKMRQSQGGVTGKLQLSTSRRVVPSPGQVEGGPGGRGGRGLPPGTSQSAPAHPPAGLAQLSQNAGSAARCGPVIPLEAPVSRSPDAANRLAGAGKAAPESRPAASGYLG